MTLVDGSVCVCCCCREQFLSLVLLEFHGGWTEGEMFLMCQSCYRGPLNWFPESCCRMDGFDPAASPSFRHTTWTQNDEVKTQLCHFYMLHVSAKPASYKRLEFEFKDYILQCWCLRARFTTKAKLLRDCNPIKVSMGEKNSAVDLRTLCNWKTNLQREAQISNYCSHVKCKIGYAFLGVK